VVYKIEVKIVSPVLNLEMEAIRIIVKTISDKTRMLLPKSLVTTNFLNDTLTTN